MLRHHRGNAMKQVALVTAGNLLVNLAFFMSHPVFTPYYTIPIAMLSLWSLLFASPDAAGGSGGRPPCRAGGSSLIMLWEAESAVSAGQAFWQ